MHFSTALAAVAAAAPLVSAHGPGSGLPTILGLSPKDLKARSILSNLGASFATTEDLAKGEAAQPLKARQDNAQCGAGVGSCGPGICCSPAGYCGTSSDYCYSPGCNYQYGPGCPENQTPAGTNTSSIARPKLGSVEYGGNGIYSCVTPGTIALTYDDGPQKVFTSHILDLLKKYNAKATFFITGNNLVKGEIDITPEFVSDIKRMDAEGHQIASHTWTHLDLSAISQIDRKNQMWKNEMALRNIVGKIPTYMRPPYSSCTGQCETDMADLGYHVIYFDVDTDDYEQDSPTLIQNSKNWFLGNITANGATAAGGATWLDIQHDIHDQTANNLTEYMLQTITRLGYRSVTVGECLGDPVANWYRTAGGAGTTISPDATCGGTKQFPAGWCGSTTAYCGTGCQPGFGNCGSSNGGGATTTTAATPSNSATTVSTDATCGGTSGFTCLNSSFGNCCSAAGWCGTTVAYCGAGCQSGFGSCTGSNAAAAAARSATPTPTPAPADPCAGAGRFSLACILSKFPRHRS
ncbi:hypothetical protein ACEQ8H_007671 [Pleosporales sp. CAS-2024a]